VGGCRLSSAIANRLGRVLKHDLDGGETAQLSPGPHAGLVNRRHESGLNVCAWTGAYRPYGGSDSVPWTLSAISVI
jgi:hypothetical protein